MQRRYRHAGMPLVRISTVSEGLLAKWPDLKDEIGKEWEIGQTPHGTWTHLAYAAADGTLRERPHSSDDPLEVQLCQIVSLVVHLRDAVARLPVTVVTRQAIITRMRELLQDVIDQAVSLIDAPT